MGFGLNNPLPSSMTSECKKAGKTLASFVDPRQSLGPDKIIPPEILANAKGLAILTVVKLSFVGSGRFGSGIVIARLADGSWSAPSAIATGGAGLGGQIGFELTDFVFILNDASAVRAFSQPGTITLGGNFSIAAGPIGRNAEVAGAASLKGVAGVFAYSKTKGLFAGVSLEGGVLVERTDANKKFYGSGITAKQLLQGSVPAPPAADPLMRVLHSRVFAGVGSTNLPDDMYNDVPVYGEEHDHVVWEGRQGEGLGEGVSRQRAASDFSGRSMRSSTWRDDVYDRREGGGTRANRANSSLDHDKDRQIAFGGGDRAHNEFDRSNKTTTKPTRPSAPKPKFGGTKGPSPGLNQALALFSFEAEQTGDLGFKKGDIIDLIKKTDSENDWWTGRIGGKEGMFPSNYVRLA